MSAMTKRVRLSLALAGATVAVLGCRLAVNELQDVESWLGCDECFRGEREAAARVGKRAVPLLARALREGPSARRRQLIDTRSFLAFRQRPIAGLDSIAYAAVVRANYVASVQERAAVSLADIGGDRALGALDAVLQNANAYRADVVAHVRALRRAAGQARFAFQVSPALVRVGDTVTVRAKTGTPFSGDELAILEDSAFSAPDLVVRREPDAIVFVAVGHPGTHVVSLTSLGPRSITEVFPLTITTLQDRSDRRAFACGSMRCQADSAEPIAVTPAQPYQTFLSLHGPTPLADDADLFRLSPGPARRLTAVLDWNGPANLDLRWLLCSTLQPVGNANGATAQRPERSSVLVPAGACWLLVVTMPNATAEPAFARLRVVSP